MAMSMQDLKKKVDDSCKVLASTGMNLNDIRLDFIIDKSRLDTAPEVEITELSCDLSNPSVVKVKIA